MRYFYDTEFLEGTQKRRLFGFELPKMFDTKPTIDLISIGIVAEDDREYYAISKDFNLEEAWNRWDGYHELRPYEKYHGFPPRKNFWIRENVLKPIFIDLSIKDYGWNRKVVYENDLPTHIGNNMTFEKLKELIQKHGKTNKEIAEEIIEFTEPTSRYYSLEGEKRFTHGSIAVGNPLKEEEIKKNNLIYHYPASNPKFYAYYADYDWVAFCWLFGKMIDLPKGFPMYTIDLKQELDNKESSLRNDNGVLEIVSEPIFEDGLKLVSIYGSIKELLSYPKQTNEHNALADALWNKKLYKFLKTL